MQRKSALVLFFVVGVALGARLWLGLTNDEQSFASYLGSTAVVIGTVVDDVDLRATSLRVTVAVQKINGEKVAGTILAVLPPDTNLQYGDAVAVRGALESPQSFLTQQGRTFDYPGYLRARGITALMQRATLSSSEAGSWSVLRTLYQLKHAFEHALERVIHGSAAALMEGFLLGEKHGLSSTLTQAFVLVGLIHVVVLSGYNIGVVSDYTLRLLGSFLPRRAALVVAAVFITLFALMAGGGMATMRALLMGLIAVIARFFRRPTAALRSLGAAGVVMLLWNPLVLFDVGFVLSVLATFGLITLAPAVERRLTFLPAWKNFDVRATAATTIAVQIFVLPALLYYTGVLSFVSVPINVVVLPFIPLAMLLGFISGMLALVHPYLALVPALLSEGLLWLMVMLVQWAAALPFAAAIVPAFSGWVAVLLYAPLTGLTIWAARRSVPRQLPS